jgi:hypothetical protein
LIVLVLVTVPVPVTASGPKDALTVPLSEPSVALSVV